MIVEDGNLLIAHRFPHVHLPDLWEFPGGKIHPGEKPEECAVREVREELGIEIEVLGLLLERPYDYADRKVDLWFFVARRLSGEPRAIGCQRWRWVRPDELKGYPLPDASLPVLDALHRGGWLPVTSPAPASDTAAPAAPPGPATFPPIPARILRGERVARAAWQVVLEPVRPEGLRFEAGQHVEVEIPEAGDLRRHLSIASPPRSRHAITLCLRLTDGDPFTTRLRGCRAGEILLLRGPLGRFRVHPGTGRPRLFVGTGTGVAPLRSMILDRADRGDSTRSVLLFGTRSEPDLLYESDFRALHASASWFRYHPSLSRPETAGWPGYRGRLTDLLPALFEDLSGWDAYLCGGAEPMQDLGAVLDQLGHPRRFRFREGWESPDSAEWEGAGGW
ncbi:MAG: NUDIX domain-containing protein [Candidatus Eisenbacteria bacterium]|nr:NUDIX domain-containing protein [Candidatus Eisenbacteria bacterium]